MSINNPAPMELRVRRVETGYTKSKIYFATNNILDSDIASLVTWNRITTALKSSAIRIDTDYLNGFVEVSGLNTNDSYIATLSLLDDFIYEDSALVSDRYLSGTEDLFNMQDVGYTTKQPISITTSEITSTSREIGSPNSNVRIVVAGEADFIVCERKLTTETEWEVFHSGEFSTSVAAGFLPGSYDIRVKGIVRFSDGTTEASSYATTTLDVNSDTLGKPNPVNGLDAKAYLVTGSVSNYDLRLSWNHDSTTGGVVRNFVVYLLENPNEVTDLTTLNWADARKEVTATPSIVYDAFPYRRTYAVRVDTNGWGEQNSDPIYTSVYITRDSAESTKLGYLVPSEVPFVSGTKIQVTDEFIRGYKSYSAELPTGNEKTFEIDAATGNVTIGSAGTYADGSTVTSPFVFDAVNNQLQISGKTITDSIISADFIMGWLGGDAPTFRTSNKSSYADNNSGIWMGYSASNTFKLDIGDSSQYIRWDGSSLNISGDVTIGSGNRTIGQTQKQVFIYKRAATKPTTPTTGSFSTPIPTGWNSTIEAGTDPVWMSHRIFTSTGAVPQESTWAEPSMFAKDGEKGDTLYTWIKYADTVTGTGLSNDPAGKEYIGVAYNKTTAIESTTASDYTWTKIKGEIGQRGPGSFEKGIPGLIAWSDTEALGAIQDKYGASAVAVDGDIVTLYDSSNPANENRLFTKIYDNSSWTTFNVTIHGSLLVDNTIKARHVNSDILTGKVLTATFIQTRESAQTGAPRVVISGSETIGGAPASNPLRVFDSNNNPILSFSESGVLQFTGGLGPSTINSLSAFAPSVLQHILPSEGTGGVSIKSEEALSPTLTNTIMLALPNANTNSVGINVAIGDYDYEAIVGTYAEAEALFGTPGTWNIQIRRNSTSGAILYDTNHTGTIDIQNTGVVEGQGTFYVVELNLDVQVSIEDTNPSLVNDEIIYYAIINKVSGYSNTPKFKSGDVGQATIGSGAVSLLGLNDVDFPNNLPTNGQTLVYNGTTNQWENIDDSRLTNARDWTASIVGQSEAESGTATTARKWTAQRVRQAAIAAASGSFAPSSHTHAASDIVSGTLSTARIPTITHTMVNFADQDLNIVSDAKFNSLQVRQKSALSTYDINNSGLIAVPKALSDNEKIGISLATSTVHGYGYSIVTSRGLNTGVPQGLSIRYHAASAPGSEVLGISSTGVISGDGSGLTSLQWANITGKPTLNLSNWNTAYSWGDHGLAGYESASNKGIANGYASLNSSGQVPSAQLPSFVDDVLEYSSLAAFPASGEEGKIYIAIDTESVYRWSGSAYIQVNDSVSSAEQATKLATARTISLGGDLSGSANFDGSSNITINAVVANDSHTHDTRYYTKTQINSYFSGTTAKAGYNKNNWDTAYSRSLINISGGGNSTLTLNKQDGTTYTTDLSHNHSANEITSGVLGVARIPTITTAKTDFANQDVKTTSDVEFNSTKVGGFKMEYDSNTESLSFNFVGV